MVCSNEETFGLRSASIAWLALDSIFRSIRPQAPDRLVRAPSMAVAVDRAPDGC